MNYIEFLQQKPTLYGSTTDSKGKQRIGCFMPCFNKYSNGICYFFMSKNGRKTNYALTLRSTFQLLNEKTFSTDTEKGNPDNYVSYYQKKKSLQQSLSP